MKKESDMIQEIIGEPLTSVNFTMDYLSLDFNQTRLTFGLMPIINTGSDKLESDSEKYADRMRSLIGVNVTKSRINDSNEFQLRFETDTELMLELVDASHEVLSISGLKGFELIK